VSSSLLTTSSSPGAYRKSTPSASYTNLFEPREAGDGEEGGEEAAGLLRETPVPSNDSSEKQVHQRSVSECRMKSNLINRKSATLPHPPKPKSLAGLAPLASFDDMTPSPTSYFCTTNGDSSIDSEATPVSSRVGGGMSRPLVRPSGSLTALRSVGGGGVNVTTIGTKTITTPAKATVKTADPPAAPAQAARSNNVTTNSSSSGRSIPVSASLGGVAATASLGGAMGLPTSLSFGIPLPSSKAAAV
jgi:hypothetical protein